MDRVGASPRARRLMRQLGIDPHALRGSGPGGRIVEADIKAAVAAASAPKIPPAVAPKPPALAPKPAPGPPLAAGISIMRRAIAEKTALSFATAPHFYLRVEADVTVLMDIRRQLVPIIEREVGAKLTLTDFLVRAMGRAVAEFPYANCIWQNNTLVKLQAIDIGVVVELPDGLLIPVLRSVDQLSLAELVKQRSDLVATARSGKLTADATQGGATSLSNLGTSPVDELAAVISPPQSSLLAVGRAAPRPFVVDGKLSVRTTIKLCLSADHRVMDGVPAAELLGHIVDLIERPARLVPDGVSVGLMPEALSTAARSASAPQ